MRSSRRHTIAGLFVLTMVLTTIAGALWQPVFAKQLLRCAGVAGWAAGLLLFSDVRGAQKIQVSLMTAAGVGLMIFAGTQGAEVDLDGVISGNTGLLTMITAVGFLRLVAVPASGEISGLPVGRQAYLRTLMATVLFGSVINISAPILIADRLHRHRPLQRFTSQSITRMFSGCAAWSPFFAGMAVVLTYVTGVQLWWIVIAGIPFTLVGLAVVYSEALWRYTEKVYEFVGYPMQPAALWIPAMLAISVILGTWFFPSLSILVLIASSALLITVVTLVKREGVNTGAGHLREHVTNGLPRIVNELTLFLAAGVLAAGIVALLQTGVLVTPISRFDAAVAVQLLAIIVIVAAVGVHPVILISSFTPLLLALDPNPNLLALTYLFAWSLGTCAGPLSGTHLVFQGRYGVPSWKAAVWNWPYVAVMYVFGAAWLYLVAKYWF